MRDRQRLHRRRHAKLRDAVQGGRVAAGVRSRCQCAIQQCPSEIGIRANEVRQKRRLRPARHPHQVVVDPRQDACRDGRRRVAVQELGANRQRLVVPARIDVRRQDVVQLRQLPVWEHAQRLQGRAGRRVPDFPQDARAALFRSQLVQPSQRKIRKRRGGQRRRADERPQDGHHGRAGESGPLILEQRGLSFVRQLEKRRRELFAQTIGRRCRRRRDSRIRAPAGLHPPRQDHGARPGRLLRQRRIEDFRIRRSRRVHQVRKAIELGRRIHPAFGGAGLAGRSSGCCSYTVRTANVRR